MLSRKQMEKEIERRYNTNTIWFIDWNWNCLLEDLSNQEISDLYNKKSGQYKDFRIFVAKDLRRQRWIDNMIIVTRRNFTNEVYYERQWDPKFNSKGFQDGFELNSYKDEGSLVRINESEVVEKIDGSYYIQENYHTCPTGHVFE